MKDYRNFQTIELLKLKLNEKQFKGYNNRIIYLKSNEMHSIPNRMGE